MNNNIKTKYRIYSDGYHQYLQYFSESKVLGLTINSSWEFIPSMKSISTWLYSESDSFISDSTCESFDQFVQKYPNIQDYLCEYEIHKKIFEQKMINEIKSREPKIVKEYE